MEAIARNHSFETALADLVDNSIDSHATHVLIRLYEQRDACVLSTCRTTAAVSPRRGSRRP